MSSVDAKYSLMDQIGQIEEQYVLEAEYTEKELKRLKEHGMSVPVEADARANAEQESPVALAFTEHEKSDTNAHEAQPQENHRTTSILWITMGVTLAAAAILLFVFLWNPDRSDVVTTTDTTKESMTEVETIEETTTAETTTEAPTTEAPKVVLQSVPIDEEHFPDEVFRENVKATFDKDGNGILDVEELKEAKELKLSPIDELGTVKVDDWGGNNVDHREEVSGTAYKMKIYKYSRSLRGIEYLTRLEKLDCQNHLLTELDLSQNQELTYLYCDDNKLASLDVRSNPKLKTLYCSWNQLTELDIRGLSELRELLCYGNQLASLNLSHTPNLWMLNCGNNHLKALDVSNLAELRELYCDRNDLSALDLSQNTQLKDLGLNGGSLTSLDLSNNTRLIRLLCEDAADLTVLDLSKLASLERLILVNVGVKELDLSGNKKLSEVHLECADLKQVNFSENAPMLHMNISCPKLAELDLRGFSELVSLTIAKSALTSLDVSQNPELIFLICNSSQLTELDVSHNPELEVLLCAYNRLTELNAGNNPKLQALDCSHNQLASLDVSHNPELVSLLCMGNALAELQVEACPKLTELSANVDTAVQGATADVEIVRHAGALSLEDKGSDFAQLEDGTYIYENNYSKKRMTLPYGVDSVLVQFDGDVDFDFLSDAIGPNSRLVDGGDALIIEGPFYIRLRGGDGSVMSSTRDRTKIRMNSERYMVEGNIVPRETFFEKWQEGNCIIIVVQNGCITEINSLSATKPNLLEDLGYVIY